MMQPKALSFRHKWPNKLTAKFVATSVLCVMRELTEMILIKQMLTLSTKPMLITLQEMNNVQLNLTMAGFSIHESGNGVGYLRSSLY